MLLIIYTCKLAFYYFLEYVLFYFQMCAHLKIIMSKFLNMFCFFQMCARLKIIIRSKLKKTGVAYASLALMVEPPLGREIGR